MDGNSASNRLAQLPSELLASMTRYLMASSICRLLTVGNSKLNYLLKNGGVLAFRHELDLRRQYWPTVVKEFPLIHEFSLGVSKNPVGEPKFLVNVCITPEQLLTLPRTLRRLYLLLHRWLPPNTRIFSLFPHLEEFECLDWHSSAETFHQIPPTLHHLSAEGLATVSLATLSVDGNMSNLDSLDLVFTNVNDSQLCEFATKFPESLKTLSVAWNSYPLPGFRHNEQDIDNMRIPRQLTHLNLASLWAHFSKLEALLQMPSTLTYLRIPLNRRVDDWRWLPRALKYLKLMNYGGIWTMTDLSQFPRTLTYLNFRHCFEDSSPNAQIDFPPDLRTYKGVDALSRRQCLQLPKRLLSLRAKCITPPSSADFEAEPFFGDAHWNFLPPSLTSLFLEELNFELPPACLASLRKLSAGFDLASGSQCLKLQNVTSSLQSALLICAETMNLSPDFPFPPGSLTSLDIECPSVSYNWATLLPNSLQKLNVLAYSPQAIPENWWSSLPRSLTALKVELHYESLENELEPFDISGLVQATLPQLRYLSISSPESLDFSQVHNLPPRLGHLTLRLTSITEFNLTRLTEMCPQLVEANVFNLSAADSGLIGEAQAMGIRLEI